MSFTPETLVIELPRLEKFAYKLCRNKPDADDLLQATVLKALERNGMFVEGGNLFGWTSKIMYNNFVSSWRRRTRFEASHDGAFFAENRPVHPVQDAQMALAEVRDAIQRLSGEHQEILIHICIDGLKYQDVAKILNVPIGTVRSRLSRARAHLQAQMDRPRTRST